MTRVLALLLLVSVLAVPARAQDDDGGEPPAPTNSNSGGNDGHINIIPLGTNKKGGNSNAGGNAAGAEGPTDPSIMYLKTYRVKYVFEHHKDFNWKMGSWGVFDVVKPREAVAAAFTTRPNGGQMGGNGHFCDITRAATSGSGCGFITWIADSPGGRPLCAGDVGAEIASNPGVWVLGGDVTGAKIKDMLKAAKVGKIGKDVCLLKPAKKYYCHLSALGWNGDWWSPDAQPGMMGEKCIGLRSSSAYDTPEQIAGHTNDPTGL